MITKQKQLFYFVGETPYKSLAEAQKADLVLLIPDRFEAVGGNKKSDIAEWLLKEAGPIVDTLTTTPTSRLKARKTHGATKQPRKPKLQPVPADT